MPTSPVLVSPPRLHPSSLLAPPIFHRRLAISPFVDLPLLIGAPEEMIVHVSEVASDPFLAAITTPPKPTVPMRSTPHPLANSTIPLMSTRVINRRHSLACKPLRSSPLAGPVIFSSCDSDEEVPVVSSEENRGARPSRMSSFPDLPSLARRRLSSSPAQPARPFTSFPFSSAKRTPPPPAMVDVPPPVPAPPIPSTSSAKAANPGRRLSRRASFIELVKRPFKDSAPPPPEIPVPPPLPLPPPPLPIETGLPRLRAASLSSTSSPPKPPSNSSPTSPPPRPPRRRPPPLPISPPLPVISPPASSVLITHTPPAPLPPSPQRHIRARSRHRESGTSDSHAFPFPVPPHFPRALVPGRSASLLNATLNTPNARLYEDTVGTNTGTGIVRTDTSAAVTSSTPRTTGSSTAAAIPSSSSANNWLATNPYAITPRFSRLSLSSPHVVLPHTPHELRRAPRVSISGATSCSAVDLGFTTQPPPRSRTHSVASGRSVYSTSMASARAASSAVNLAAQQQLQPPSPARSRTDSVACGRSADFGIPWNSSACAANLALGQQQFPPPPRNRMSIVSSRSVYSSINSTRAVRSAVNLAVGDPPPSPARSTTSTASGLSVYSSIPWSSSVPSLVRSRSSRSLSSEAGGAELASPSAGWSECPFGLPGARASSEFGGRSREGSPRSSFTAVRGRKGGDVDEVEVAGEAGEDAAARSGMAWSMRVGRHRRGGAHGSTHGRGHAKGVSFLSFGSGSTSYSNAYHSDSTIAEKATQMQVPREGVTPSPPVVNSKKVGTMRRFLRSFGRKQTIII